MTGFNRDVPYAMMKMRADIGGANHPFRVPSLGILRFGGVGWPRSG